MAENEKLTTEKKVGSNPNPVDAYDGKYKNRADTASAEEKFGTGQMPVQDDKVPYKLKGGS